MSGARSIGFLFLLLLACGTSPWPDHKKLAPGVYLRLCELGDGIRSPKDSDRVTLHLRAGLLSDAPGAALSGEFMLDWPSLAQTALGKGLRRMHEGDSAVMIMPVDGFPWSLFSADPPVPDTLLTVSFRLAALRTQAEVNAEEAAFNAWVADQELEEQAELSRWLRANGLDSTHRAWPGIYHVETKRGKGEKVRTGDVVSIHFRSTLLDGTTVEDTERIGQPFTLRLGDPEQVIYGLEVALRRMRPSGEGMFVIPSQFGFGHVGAGGGIVPPFSTLIYHIRVLERSDAPA